MMGAGYYGKKAMAQGRWDDEVTQGPRMADDWGLSRARGWKLVLCILPKTCFLTGKNLWGKRCYKGTRIITGPGEPVIEDYYIEKFEFIKWQLTRT
jgi:hypothetical protein